MIVNGFVPVVAWKDFHDVKTHIKKEVKWRKFCAVTFPTSCCHMVRTCTYAMSLTRNRTPHNLSNQRHGSDRRLFDVHAAPVRYVSEASQKKFSSFFEKLQRSRRFTVSLFRVARVKSKAWLHNQQATTAI